MKKIYLLSIFVLIVGIFSCIYVYYFRDCIIINSISEDYLRNFVEDNNIINKKNRGILGEEENAIANKETALNIGKAVLKEHFSNFYNDIEEDIVVKDFSEFWVVYNEVKVSRFTFKNYSVKSDSCVYVFIRKLNGEIVNVGIGI